MNGMHQEQAWAYTTDSDNYTPTWQYELPPTNTLVQVSLGDYYEFDDKSHVDLGLISGSYLDSNGVTRQLNFPDIDAFGATHVLAQPGLTSIVYGTKVSNAAMSVVANFFFWDRVS
jgi:hypothetical protein